MTFPRLGTQRSVPEPVRCVSAGTRGEPGGRRKAATWPEAVPTTTCPGAHGRRSGDRGPHRGLPQRPAACVVAAARGRDRGHGAAGRADEHHRVLAVSRDGRLLVDRRAVDGGRPQGLAGQRRRSRRRRLRRGRRRPSARRGRRRRAPGWPTRSPPRASPRARRRSRRRGRRPLRRPGRRTAPRPGRSPRRSRWSAASPRSGRQRPRRTAAHTPFAASSGNLRTPPPCVTASARVRQAARCRRGTRPACRWSSRRSTHCRAARRPGARRRPRWPRSRRPSSSSRARASPSRTRPSCSTTIGPRAVCRSRGRPGRRPSRRSRGRPRCLPSCRPGSRCRTR